MVAGGAEELATSQARGAFHVLTAVNAIEFQETVEWIDSVHTFLIVVFDLHQVMRKAGAKSIKIFS